MKKRKNIVFTLGGLLTMLVVYVIVRLVINDSEYVVRGWHTTIYPPEIISLVLTIIIIAICIMVYFIFRGAIELLTLLLKNK